MRKLGNLLREKLKQEKWNIFLFFVVMTLVFFFIRKNGPMAGSVYEDAGNMWLTITTFGTEDMHGSYVLYKGLFSFFPYILCYRAAIFLGLNEFFFVRLFHAMLFAYLTAFGLPGIARHFLGNKVKFWQRALLSSVLFFLWKGTGAITNMWVDLPRCAYLVYAVNQVTRLARSSFFSRWFVSLWAGFSVGMCFCLGGTNFVSGLCLIAFAVANLMPVRMLKQHAKRWIALGCAALFLAGCLVLPVADTLFETQFVAPMRDEGAWIFEKDDLFLLSLSALFENYGKGGFVMRSPRGFALLINDYGEEMAERFRGGNTPMTLQEYFKIAYKHPVDMLAIWANRLFLLLTASFLSRNVAIYFMCYTLLYLAGLTAIKRCGTWGAVFRQNLWLVLAFVMALTASVMGITEMRMGLPAQALYIAIGLCSDTLWDGYRILGRKISAFWREKNLRSLLPQSFPWSFCLWAVFVVICLSRISLLLEMSPDYTLLYPRFLLFRLFN